MTFTIVTQPEDEPLSLAEVKEFLRIDGDDQDATIDAMFTAAREYCEEVLSRQLMPATLRLSLDAFPESIVLPRPPLISLTASESYPTLGISYVDSQGATQTLATSVYQVDSYSEPAKVVLAYNQSWPDTRTQVNAVNVTYRAGYADADSVPNRIKQAILMLTAHWYENRESVGQVGDEIAFSVHSLLGLDRVGVI